MPLITVFLIILFFIVLAFKPTYICVHTETDGETGFVFTQAPLIIAIAFKVACWNQLIILSGKEYNAALELYNEIKQEQDDDDIDDFTDLD